MPAIPVAPPKSGYNAGAPQQGIFERGDHVYLTTPVQLVRPSADQIEEFAFSTQVKSSAPNENILWLKGQYVEADHANRNGAMWRSGELGIKSMTPMLMPVTVMHDPRTAVGTIADVKMLTPDADKVPRARIDTVLALWAHRFPEVMDEVEENAKAGTLMQSMECYSPWYECSICGSVFHKLPLGAERARWCDHLRASNPSGGAVDDLGGSPNESSAASRILGDVCFTGTGLIFGTQGAKGAYDEAYLEEFQDELAEYHHQVHESTSSRTSTPTSRGHRMSLVQIEQSELDMLRKERDDARTETAAARDEKTTAERAAEAAETAKVAAEGERDQAKTDLTAKNEELARAQLKDKRWGDLGEGFVAKLGDFTKGRLQEQAGTLKDEEWDARLQELEEVAAVKRDAKKEEGASNNGGSEGSGGEPTETVAPPAQTFSLEEVARASGLGTPPANGGAPSEHQRASVIGSLSSAFAPKK